MYVIVVLSIRFPLHKRLPNQALRDCRTYHAGPEYTASSLFTNLKKTVYLLLLHEFLGTILCIQMYASYIYTKYINFKVSPETMF